VKQGGMNVPDFLQLNHTVLRALAIAQGAPAHSISSAERANAAFIRPHADEIDKVFGGMH